MARWVQVSNCSDSSESLEKRQAGSITVTRAEPDTGAQRDRCLREPAAVIKNTKASQQADRAHTGQRPDPVNDPRSSVLKHFWESGTSPGQRSSKSEGPIDSGPSKRPGQRPCSAQIPRRSLAGVAKLLLRWRLTQYCDSVWK